MKKLSEVENGNIGKEVHRWHFSTRIFSHRMLLLVLACLHKPAGSSLLPHISAGSHISAGPQISAGPHRPWSSSQRKPWGSHPHHREFHPVQHKASHPGYQTNIVIDPYAKVSLKIIANCRFGWIVLDGWGIPRWQEVYGTLQ